MPMTEMRIGDQTIRYDRDATAAVYRTINRGDAEECGCLFCENFAVQRDLVYPASFRALLEQVGIDPAKEGEVFEYGPAQDGHYSYGGWFYFVREMVSAGEKNTASADSHHFEFWFTSHCLNAPAFRGGPLLAVEFTTTPTGCFRRNPSSGG
jgi:hypothetical protein